MKTHVREREIFEEAVNISDADRRQAYLREACAEDATLHARLRTLVDNTVAAEDFFAAGRRSLERHLQDIPSPADRSALSPPDEGSALPDELLGTRIGNYRIVKNIGEGGCGTVYEADQVEPVQRKVALKIIKIGIESRAFAARFEWERQALAMMEHPNIARVFDAGTTTRGFPYLVMELAEGQRITDYCDVNQMTVGDRLELMISVCNAMLHVHQKGIVHRDIKPSNVLIVQQDGKPTPKIIDFGIAKAREPLRGNMLNSANVLLIGTPTYMSPEQAAAGTVDIDTRSDIYSLGVLLYELLTGTTPFSASELSAVGLDEMRRILRERDPLRPSARLHSMPSAELKQVAARRGLAPRQSSAILDGDLDGIVMKAMEKDRDRRYGTAGDLAADIRRYMNHEVVLARPPSAMYRLTKSVRRNRALFMSGVLVLATLLTGLGSSTWLYLREREARWRAEAAEQKEAGLRRVADERQKITEVTLLLRANDFVAADTMLERISVLRPSVEAAGAFRAIGEWHAIEGRWGQAAAYMTKLLSIDAFDGLDVATLDLLRAGPTFANVDVDEVYQRFCHDTIARYSANSRSIELADRVLKICLLHPVSPEMRDSLAEFAATIRLSLGQDEVARQPYRSAWRTLALVLWAYRTGKPLEAIALGDHALAAADQNLARNATVHIVMAMAHAKVGNEDAANANLRAGRLLIQHWFKSPPDLGNPALGFWFDWEFARVLLREAEHAVKQP